LKTSRFEVTNEQLLWSGLLLLALVLRLSGLGEIPFSDHEAYQALGALAASDSQSPFWTTPLPAPNPAYQVLAGWLFQLFGSSDVMARIPSVVAGLALVLTPLLLRRRFGAGLALSIGFLFCVSPVLLTISRSAGGESLALLGIAGAFFAVIGGVSGSSEKRAALAGAGLGLALASGSSGYTALLALLLTWIMIRRLAPDQEQWPGFNHRNLLVSALLSALILVSGFGMDWHGVAGVGEGFADWLHGWSSAGQVNAPAFLAMMFSFEPLVIFFGTAGILLAFTRRLDRIDRFMVIWTGWALVLNLLRIGRGAGDIVWVILPLIWLAGRTLIVLSNGLTQRGGWLQTVVLTGALLILTASAGVSVISYLQGYRLSQFGSSPSFLYFIFGALLLMAASLIFIFGMEWSWRVVLDSAAITVFIVGLSLSVQAAWRLNMHSSQGGARLLWSPIQATDQLALLEGTLAKASLVESGMPASISIQVDSDLPPSMAWYLREYGRVSGEFAVEQSAPVAMLTPGSKSEVRLPAEYYGQTFALRTIPDKAGSLPAPGLRWWVLDESQALTESWTLWVRADVAGLGEAPARLEP
jgi:hypothetical protein